MSSHCEINARTNVMLTLDNNPQPTVSSFATAFNLLQQRSFSLLRQQTQERGVHFLPSVWT